jgi:hypothetical protein
MMRRKCERIRIGKIVYPIIRVVRILFRGRECDGLFCPKEQEIKMRSGVSDDRAFEVKWHEALHAIEHQHCIELTERVVGILTNGICDILRSNTHMRRG